MSLTPEDVLNQRFTITKFRDGYDLEQVDDFLDVIVEELRQHEQAKEELRTEIEELTAKLEAAESARDEAPEAAPSGEEPATNEEEVSDRTIVVDAPKPAVSESETPTTEAAAFSAGAQGDAVKSSAMLQLALELHDKHIHEGETQRDQLVNEAETTAKRLIEDAQKQRSDELRMLGDERSGLQGKIRELRDFEREYRSTLRSYIQSQLRGLDGSPEPDGAPEGLQ